MLGTVIVETSIKDPESVGKCSTINGVSTDNKMSASKSEANSRAKLSKSKNTTRPNFLVKSKLLVESNLKPSFQTPKARLGFARLRQAFIKAAILYHFDLKCHIWVETNASGYVISKISCQLTLDDLGW